MHRITLTNINGVNDAQLYSSILLINVFQCRRGSRSRRRHRLLVKLVRKLRTTTKDKRKQRTKKSNDFYLFILVAGRSFNVSHISGIICELLEMNIDRVRYGDISANYVSRTTSAEMDSRSYVIKFSSADNGLNQCLKKSRKWHMLAALLSAQYDSCFVGKAVDFRGQPAAIYYRIANKISNGDCDDLILNANTHAYIDRNPSKIVNLPKRAGE